MKVMVIGNDLRTQILIKSLLNTRHDIVLISSDRGFCEQVSNQSEKPTVHGDASQPDVLAAAGAGECDLLISMLEKDADNLVVCELAKRMFNVPRTITAVENPVNCTVFQRLGVDSVICSAEACSRMVENAIATAV